MPHLEPVQIAALAFALVVGIVLGFIGNTSGGRWRKRYQKDRDFYADYREKSERLIADKSRQIAELEARLAQATVPVTAPGHVVEAPVAEETAPPAEAEPVAELVAEPAPTPAPESVDPTVAAPLALAASDMVADAHGEPVVDPEPHAVTEAVEHPADPSPEPVAAAASDDGIVDAHFEPVPEEEAIAVADPESAGGELTHIRGIDAALAARLAAVGVRTPQDIERLSAEDEMALEKRLDLSTGQIALEQWRLQAALIGSGEEPDHAVSTDTGHHIDATADPHDSVDPAPHRPMAVASEGAAAV